MFESVNKTDAIKNIKSLNSAQQKQCKKQSKKHRKHHNNDVFLYSNNLESNETFEKLANSSELINKKVSIQEFEWLKKLVLDKNLLLNFIREEPEKIDCWLHNTSYLICSYLNFNN